MMKKILALLGVLALLLAMTACGEEKTETSAQTPSESTSAPTASTTETATEETEESTEEPTEASTVLTVGQSVNATFLDEFGTIYAMALVPVQNNGETAVCLPMGVLEFTNAAGETVFRAESVAAYPDVIGPGETAYYFEQVAPDIADAEALTATLQPVEATPVEQVVRLDTSGFSYLRNSPYGGMVLTGTVKNTTAADQDMVCVAAVLYEGEEPFAVIYTVLMETVAAGTSLDFTIEHYLLPETVRAETVTRYELVAFPMD